MAGPIEVQLGILIAPEIEEARKVFRWLDDALREHRRKTIELVSPPVAGQAHHLLQAYSRRRGYPLRCCELDQAPPPGISRILSVTFRGSVSPASTPERAVLRLDLQWTREVFVYGSNLEGRNGKGAAAAAKIEWGAKPLGEGRQYQCYALPTKQTPYVVLPLERIRQAAQRFIEHAHAHPDEHFLLTPVGTGLSGYKPAQIAPMFERSPDNVSLIDERGQVCGPARAWFGSLSAPVADQATMRTSEILFAAK